MNIFQRLFGRAPNSGAAGGDYREPRLRLVFPMELGGLQRRTKGRPYAEGNRQGESLAYGGNQVEATVYVTQVGQAEFPDGSPLGRATLDRQVMEDVGAILHGMQRAEECRNWSSRLRRGD